MKSTNRIKYFSEPCNKTSDAAEGGANLLGVELHLALSLGKELNVIGSVYLLGNYSNLVSDRELKRIQK